MRVSATAARRWTHTIVGLLADAYLFLVLSLAVWVLLPTLVLGWGPVLVSSGSMAPAIRTGDIVLLDRPSAQQPVAPGTVLTYRDGDGADARLVTHRVRRLDRTGAYVTRGDANDTDDLHPVPGDRVEGYGRLLVPLLGRPVHWARSGQPLPLALVTMLTLGATAISVRTSRHVVRTAVPVRQPTPEPARATVDPGCRVDAVRAAVPTPASAGTGHEVLFGHLVTTQPAEPYLWGPDVPPVTRRPVAEPAAAALARASRVDRARPIPPVATARRQGRLPSRVAVLVAFLVLLAGGGQLPVAEAALRAATGSAGNTFATAAADPDGEPLPPTVVLPPSDGRDTISAGSRPESVVFELPVGAATTLDGTAQAILRVRPSTSGNPPRSVEIVLRGPDGTVLAVAATEQRLTGGWTVVTLSFDDALDVTLPAGSALTVEVVLRRLELDIGGGSSLQLPVVGG
jgi:signal peptidase I